MPPSALLKADKDPLATVKSPLVKPDTASEKVAVSVAVLPALDRRFIQCHRRRGAVGINLEYRRIGGAAACITGAIQHLSYPL